MKKRLLTQKIKRKTSTPKSDPDLWQTTERALTVTSSLSQVSHRIPRRDNRSQSRQMLKGQEPFGFKIVAGKLVTHKGEQRVIDWIKEKRKLGLSLRRIAGQLTEKGIKTKNGGRWQANTIRKILQSSP